MRAPADTIPAPPFLTHLRWANVSSLRMDRQLGKPVLIEFWDFCRPNSLRTLPYLKAWHERYEQHGLRVVGIHSPGFDLGREKQTVKDAVARLGVDYPVLIDTDLEMWREYENQGWPARYLFDQHSMLFHYHYGEGAYLETELAIQELLGCEREPFEPLRPEDSQDAELAVQTEDQPSAYSGPYEAGGVWVVLDGTGTLLANGAELTVSHPGAYPLIEHERHTAGVLELQVGDGLQCLATCFTPGIV
ncbi:MAG TPA: redoxin domain-containing protein [Solirubrobacteraceae bacterium]|nr:redoxin domain-containing protein [Solirubrobacteraceae bacterium]